MKAAAVFAQISNPTTAHLRLAHSVNETVKSFDKLDLTATKEILRKSNGKLPCESTRSR
jgi:hypothetical protein